MTGAYLGGYRRDDRRGAPLEDGWSDIAEGAARRARFPDMKEETERRSRRSMKCAAIDGYDLVCRANDSWAERIPGETGDGASTSELERAYDAFYAAAASSVEGLRLQFETLVAIADLEGDSEIHPGGLVLLENIRRAFQRFSAEPESR